MPLSLRIGAAAFLATLVVPPLPAHGAETAPGAIHIASYNVSNYLEMPRRVDGRLRNRSGKPVSERDSVACMISSLSPDVVGIMEMGDDSQIADLLRRLKERGLDYSDRETVQGGDPTRHLLLLSRYPIVERHSQGDVPLSVKGLPLHSPRGIVDVTVRTPDGEHLRLLCVHLKARVPVPEYDEAALREAEAEYLERRVRSILKEDPRTNLVVMGDFNAARNGREMKALIGDAGRPGPLRMIPLADDRGESWTEYWSDADIYSRIDYILTTPALADRIVSAHSGVARPSDWRMASDHCPIHITLLPNRDLIPPHTVPSP